MIRQRLRERNYTENFQKKNETSPSVEMKFGYVPSSKPFACQAHPWLNFPYTEVLTRLRPVWFEAHSTITHEYGLENNQTYHRVICNRLGAIFVCTHF